MLPRLSGYDEMSTEPSLLGCGGNVIVNVETIIDHLEGEDSLTEDEEKLLELCKSAKEQDIGDLILFS